ncbi:MAG: 3-deoxy-manno-octulosonate cytidylyltransferase [Pyrinomonadaceae bacterium]
MNHAGPNSKEQSHPSAVAIIPARFDSTRLPGKVLLEIAGKPMILWVVERALAAANVNRVIVATDDERISEAVHSFGHEVMMTSRDHQSGTDRLAEIAATLPDVDIIVNVQGDEPLIAPETIERAIEALSQDPAADMVTTWEQIDSAEDVLNPDVVKIVINDTGRAIYFSREPVPHIRHAAQRHGSLANALASQPELVRRFKKHTGLYAYRRQLLMQFTKWPQTELERLEGLEQLRALEHGVRIKVIEASTPSIGVDNPSDLKRVRAVMEQSAFHV